MFTRKQYLSNVCTFAEYYDQFVTPEILNRVTRDIGLDRLLASKDEHLNDIPLKEWDALFGGVFRSGQMIVSPTVPHDINKMLKECGEGGASMATLVCIAKQAARQLINNAKTCPDCFGTGGEHLRASCNE